VVIPSWSHPHGKSPLLPAALSATPGNTVAKLQEIITNLRIARVEFRSEDDPEIMK
jgi:ERCC4-related helicase